MTEAHQKIQRLVKEVADSYYDVLANRNTVNPRYLVLFSGVPGSGKSTIARAITDELRGVLVSNDDIRDLIVRIAPTTTATREKVKLDVVTALLERLPTIPNGLVVNDASVDRGYDYYADWAQKYGYRIIVFRMDMPRSVIEQRIQGRGDTGYRNASDSLANLDNWWEQWEEFGKTCKPTMTITENTSIDDVLEVVRYQLADKRYSTSESFSMHPIR